MVSVQNITDNKLGGIISLTLSFNAEKMVVGNHNSETYIYSRVTDGNGNYRWEEFETLRATEDASNFVKCNQFSDNANFLVTGNDDFYLRFYTLGTCPENQSFNEFGKC